MLEQKNLANNNQDGLWVLPAHTSTFSKQSLDSVVQTARPSVKGVGLLRIEQEIDGNLQKQSQKKK